MQAAVIQYDEFDDGSLGANTYGVGLSSGWGEGMYLGTAAENNGAYAVTVDKEHASHMIFPSGEAAEFDFWNNEGATATWVIRDFTIQTPHHWNVYVAYHWDFGIISGNQSHGWNCHRGSGSTNGSMFVVIGKKDSSSSCLIEIAFFNKNVTQVEAGPGDPGMAQLVSTNANLTPPITVKATVTSNGWAVNVSDSSVADLDWSGNWTNDLSDGPLKDAAITTEFQNGAFVFVHGRNSGIYTGAPYAANSSRLESVKVETGSGGGSEPSRPADPVALATGPSEMRVYWSDSSPIEQGFEIDRRPSGGEWAQVAAMSSNTTSYVDTNLTASTKYYYRIRAYNAAGDSPSSDVAWDTTLAAGEQLEFIAYNDLAWSSGQTAQKITRYGSGQSGHLTNWLTGADAGCDLAVSAGIQMASNALPHAALPGTDGWNVFCGRVNADGYLEYATTSVTCAVADLNPAWRYEIVAYGNRNWTSYTARTTSITLSNAVSFVNASTAGAQVGTNAMPGDTATIVNGYNTANGCVARFVDVDPGADGMVALSVPGWSGSGEAGKYYLNVLMIKGLSTQAAEPEPVEKIARGSAWSWKKGSAEASSPVAAWRGLDYYAGGWAVSNAPFGYGRTQATELADMRSNYPSIFMRKTFTVASPGLVSKVRLDGEFDDGCVIWLNGDEIFRTNVAGSAGAAVACTNWANANQSATFDVTIEKGALPELRGTNVLAVQAFNVSLGGSGDFLIDVGLSAVEGSAIAGDADGDGMPDDWEDDVFGGASEPNAGTDQDYDGDGQKNIAEWVAGTDASNSNDCFGVDLRVAGSDVMVSFPTKFASGAAYTGLTRHYRLEQRQDLLIGDIWKAVPGYEDIAALVDGTVSHTNSTGALPFFRGRVWLE